MSGVLVITGARGFIGAAVMHALRAQAPARTIVVAGRTGGSSTAVGGYRHIYLDLSDSAIELPAGISTVLHLAGEKRDVAHMDAVNHIGAVRLVEAAARAGARSFVHLSSVGVYGAPKHAGTVDESHAHTPRNPYEVSKDAGERAVREHCASLGLTCVVLQPSSVIGVVPGRSYPLLGLARMVARGWFRHFGAGDGWVNYVAVEDVAAALAAATLDGVSPGTFIVNTPVTLVSLVRWIAEELDVPEPTARLPMWVGSAASAAGAIGRALLHRELAFSPERFLELTNTTRYDGSPITHHLDFTYKLGIESALRAMMRLYRREGAL